MPALKPTSFTAKIVWIGTVDPATKSIRSESAQTGTLSFEGLEGDSHSGLTRPSCMRVLTQYERGTDIRNTRQLSVLSQEELDATAAEMGLDGLDPAWLGASLVLEGIPDFTHIPPSSRLQAENGACLIIDMQNRPCVLPGKVIEGEAPGHGPKFKAAAKNRRGVTASVERPGAIALGDTLRLHVPDQRAWAHFEEARAE